VASIPRGTLAPPVHREAAIARDECPHTIAVTDVDGEPVHVRYAVSWDLDALEALVRESRRSPDGMARDGPVTVRVRPEDRRGGRGL
jgi:hypothetical protein